MKKIEFLNYLNLIVGIVILLTHLNMSSINDDYIFTGSFALAVWYNWETSKRLRGQRNGLNTFNFVVGVFTILFAVLLTFWGAGLIQVMKDRNAQQMMGWFYAAFGVLTTFVVLKTIKFYRSR